MSHGRKRATRKSAFGQEETEQTSDTGFGTRRGATGADQYVLNRLQRASTYLRGSGYSSGVIATLALSPLDDQDLDRSISVLGGTPGKGYGITDLLDRVSEGRSKPVLAPSDIRKLKANLIEQGWVHPDTPIDSSWKPGDPFWQGNRNMEDWARKKGQRGEKTGSLSAQQALGYINNMMPKEAWRGLRGFAEVLVKETAGAIGRAGINIGRIPGEVVAVAQGQEEEEAYLKKTRQIEKKYTGKEDEFANDAVAILSLIPALKAAGVLGKGAKAVTMAERGLMKAGPGLRGGLRETIVSKGLRKVVTPTNEALAAKIAEFGPGGFRAAAGRLLAGSDRIARMKSTPLGELGTSILNAGTQTSLAARGLGAIGQGEILPNVDISNLKKSRLTQLIDETPALGSSLKYHILGKENPLGNPVDLMSFVWNPTQSLPIRMKDVRNGITNLVGYDHVRPLTRYFRAARGERVTRASLIEEFGGQENLAIAIRFFKAQGAAMKEASERLRGVSEDKLESAFPHMLQKVKADMKGNKPLQNSMIDGATDMETTEALRYFFKDYPEAVGARNGGTVDLRSWIETMKALGEVDVKTVKVQPFKRGQNLWAKVPGNAEALDEAYEDLATMVYADDPEKLLWGKQMLGGDLKIQAATRRRVNEIVSEGEVAYIRADNPLAAAQDISVTTSVLIDLLRNQRDLKAALGRRLATPMGDDVMVNLPKYIRLSDLRAAGLSPADFDLSYPTRTPLTIEQAEQLGGSLAARVDEIKGTINTYLPEMNKLDDKKLIKKMKRRSAIAGRAIDLPDQELQARMFAAGKRPVLLNKNALTLRDVDPGNIVDTLGEGSRLANVSEWLGLHNKRLNNLDIAGLRTPATRNELDQVAKETGIAATGDDLMQQLATIREEIPGQATRIRTPGRKSVWRAGEIFDLRQIKIKDMVDHGWTEAHAEAVYAAVRRGAAFGFDAAHPLRTIRSLGEALQISGLPGFEDAARTLVSANSKLGYNKFSRQILNIPDSLVRARDFIQFQMSPYFTLGNVVEAKLLKGASNLPMDIRPGKVKRLAQEFARDFGEEFDEVQDAVMGYKKSKVYASTMEEVRLGEHGFFGFSTLDAEAVDSWRLYQRQKAQIADGSRTAVNYTEIRDEIDKIYRYGPRSAAEKSANYIFFPLSFGLKMGRSVSDWYMQAPARILMTQAGLKTYDDMSKEYDWAGKVERYLPILRELNKLNVFARGLGITTGPLGGRNKLMERAGKAFLGKLDEDPALGAFIPVGFASEDYYKGQGLLTQLNPLMRQVMSFWQAAGDQASVATKKNPLEQIGSKEYQVDNYYLEMGELKRTVEQEMADLGLKPSMKSLSSKLVNPEFKEAVEAEKVRIGLKYPAGGAFADAYADDASDKAQELIAMAENPINGPGESALLYFAAQVKQLEIGAHERTKQQNSLIKARSPGTQLSGELIDDELDDQEIDLLRRLAYRFARAEKEFIPLYKRYFLYELGPIVSPAAAPGTAA